MSKQERTPTEHKIPLTGWRNFCSKVLDNTAFLYVKGSKPDKIFQVCTKDGAAKAIDLLTRLGIKNWALFSVEGYEHWIVLMATAWLVKDLQMWSKTDIKIYAEDHIAYIDGRFPDTCKKKLDKEKWRKFVEKMKDGK